MLGGNPPIHGWDPPKQWAVSTHGSRISRFETGLRPRSRGQQLIDFAERYVRKHVDHSRCDRTASSRPVDAAT